MPPRIAPRASHASPNVTTRACRSSKNSIPNQTHHREFSYTTSQPFHASCRHETRLRRNMYAWLNGPGRVFREPLPGSTNYLGAYDRSGNLIRLRDSAAEQEETEETDEQLSEDEKAKIEEDEAGLSDFEKEQRKEQREAEAADEKEGKRTKLPKEKTRDLRPFPLNQSFRSEAVLSEGLREEIYRQVIENGQSVQTVSAVYGVDMRRVAAVVRLKTVEQDWIKQGKQLAKPYQSAILAMLPQTQFIPGKKITSHESINDLPVHPHTRQQIFYPTSESRQFTRVDAAKVFSPTLLPADERIPHPELIQLERDIEADVPREDRVAAVKARDDALRKAKEEQERKRLAWEQKNLKTVTGQRWDFKFQNVSVDAVGKDGRGRAGVGWRYGMPHEDRKRGQVKIPTSVE